MISISTLHSFWLRLPALLARLALLLAFGVFAASAGAQTTVTFFHNDILGSPTIATDADGAVVWKENYLPYGHRLQAPAAGANNKLWFAGKQFDPNTGLSYMGARYYIPLMGRFTGVDPVDFKEENIHSFNRYAYANNNPYKYVDPDGRQAEVNVFPNFDPMQYLKALAVESAKFAAMAAGGAGGAAEKVVAASVTAKGAAQALSVEGKALLTANPVGSALKADPAHLAATFMREEAATNGTNFAITGGDGVTRTLTQVPGGFNGVAGRYEYIVDSVNNLTHQMFVRGGSINGIPIKP